MSSPAKSLRPSGKTPARIPPLENGDRLTRAEFERRYEAMPNLKKAELLEGVVCMPSPVRFQHHGNPHAKLVGWVAIYEAYTPGTGAMAGTSIRLDDESEPQPDLGLIILPECGGQAKISEDDYVEQGPELAGEISASTVSIDLDKKLRIYRRNKVREYIVWRVEDGEIDWFVLRQADYEKLPLDAAGCYQSEVFPGLWLDAAALIRFDMPQVFRVLQEGLASPEHAAFVAKLQSNRPV